MKKFALIAGFALLGTVILPSCKKDYTCTCTVEVDGLSVSAAQPLGKQTKKDAKAACKAFENVDATTGVAATCEL